MRTDLPGCEEGSLITAMMSPPPPVPAPRLGPPHERRGAHDDILDTLPSMGGSLPVDNSSGGIMPSSTVPASTPQG